MKKIILFIIFVILSVALLRAQCPATIQLVQTPDNPVCKNESATFTVATSAGGITSYLWVVNGDTLTTTNPSISTGIDYAVVEVYAVSDTCSLDTMYAVKQVLNVEIQADYNVIVEECNQPRADVEILNITGGQSPYSYNFYTSSGGLGEQDVYTDIPISAYPLVVTDDNGCIDTTWVNIEAYQCPPPVPIQAITPNEDGYNDSWIISNINFYPNNEVFIYDRWGQRVYHKEGYTNTDGWKAEYLGANMPVSTYYYVLKIKYDKQEEEVYNGAVSVFR